MEPPNLGRYIVALTIGPAFFSAAIYLCLARIIAVYGEGLSWLQPRTYTITFMVSDFVALILQASGGAILGGQDISNIDMGRSVIQAGLAAHLIAIVVFVGLALESGIRSIRTYRNPFSWDTKFADLQDPRKFVHFVISLVVATLCIFILTAFRVAQLSQGLDSKLANDEVAFIILEGAMFVIDATSLTIFHPGPGFQGRWDEANFQLRSKNRNKSSEEGSTQLNSVAS